MTHGYFLFNLGRSAPTFLRPALLSLWVNKVANLAKLAANKERADIPYLANPATGQFSRRMPKVSPLLASTSLISLSDLRPKFGVLSNSFSVR